MILGPVGINRGGEDEPSKIESSIFLTDNVFLLKLTGRSCSSRGCSCLIGIPLLKIVFCGIPSYRIL